MKKLLALVLCLALTLPMLLVPASAEEVQVIKMWSNDQHDQSVFNAKIEEFNSTVGKENGVAVECTVYGSDYYTTLDVAVSAGEGPDIFQGSLAAIEACARRLDMTMPQPALAYNLSWPGISCVIPGGRTAEQVRRNAAAAGLRISPEEREKLFALPGFVY